MNIIHHILIPVDFSLSASASINYVLGMAKGDPKLHFTLLNVVNEEDNAPAALKQLDELKKIYFDSVHIKCQTMVASDSFVEAVAKVVREQKIDLILMGTHGNIDDRLESTHTVDLIEVVRCPIFVIPENVTGFRMKNIVLSIDEKELDHPSELKVFHDIAKWFGAKVHLLKVARKEKELIAEIANEDTLDYYLDSLEYQYSIPQNADIEEGFSEYIKEKHIDALAILPRMRSGKSDGKLTKALAMHTNIPLLVIS